VLWQEELAVDHRPLYYDDNHLSLFGSYLVGRK